MKTERVAGGGIEGGREERQKEEEKEYIKSRLGCLTTWYPSQAGRPAGFHEDRYAGRLVGLQGRKCVVRLS